MKKFVWLYNRLKQMSVIEIFKFRIPQFFQIHFFGHFQKNKKCNPSKIWLNNRYKSPTYKTDIINELLSKYTCEYSFFNAKINLFEVKDWRKDYKNNTTSKLCYYGKINRQDLGEQGDIKYVAELSRFHFLPFIAFKYISTKESEFSNFITDFLTDWELQNPYLNSIHWTSGIEVGIRSVNLIYTHQVLNNTNVLTQKQDFLIKKLICYNYEYLKNHLSLFSSANNHLIGELLGLVAISNYFSSSNFNVKKWNSYFFKEFGKQINNDGVDMEISTRYHAAVTDHFLNGFEFIKNSGNKIPVDITSKFKKMFDFVNHSNFIGNTVCFGDDDNSKLIYPYFDDNFSLYESLLQSSNHLFEIKYNNGNLDSRNYLIFGNKINNKINKAKYRDVIFKDSGFCFMYDNAAKLSFDVGKIGDDLLAAHGHSDLLHFTFENEGIEYIVDSGTYQYHQDTMFWRNYFKGISAHNCISVNNKNHAVSNGRMGWLNNPKTELVDYEFNSTKSLCIAKNEGFKDDGILHERKIEFDKSEKIIHIIDKLKTSNKHKKSNICFYLHFHPKVKVIHVEDTIKLIADEERELSIRNKFFKNAEIIKGDKITPLGWHSNSYDTKTPTSTLKLQLKLCDDTTLITTIDYIYS